MELFQTEPQACCRPLGKFVLYNLQLSSSSEAVKHTRSRDAASPSSLFRCPVTDVTGPPTVTVKPCYINRHIVTVVFIIQEGTIRNVFRDYPLCSPGSVT